MSADNSDEEPYCTLSVYERDTYRRFTGGHPLEVLYKAARHYMSDRGATSITASYIKNELEVEVELVISDKSRYASFKLQRERTMPENTIEPLLGIEMESVKGSEEIMDTQLQWTAEREVSTHVTSVTLYWTCSDTQAIDEFIGRGDSRARPWEIALEHIGERGAYNISVESEKLVSTDDPNADIVNVTFIPKPGGRLLISAAIRFRGTSMLPEAVWDSHDSWEKKRKRLLAEKKERDYAPEIASPKMSSSSPSLQTESSDPSNYGFLDSPPSTPRSSVHPSEGAGARRP